MVGRFDGILVEMAVIGIIKVDGEKKAKAMFLIGDEYATLTEYLGWREEVTYIQFQQAMLKREGRETISSGKRSVNG